MDVFARINRSLAAIQDIYNSVRNRNDIRDVVTVGETPQMWNFRVYFKNSNYSLSISVPPDMSVGFCETALFSGDNLIYRHEWGYQDVARFKNIDDLCHEIRRVAALTTGNSENSKN